MVAFSMNQKDIFPLPASFQPESLFFDVGSDPEQVVQ